MTAAIKSGCHFLITRGDHAVFTRLHHWDLHCRAGRTDRRAVHPPYAGKWKIGGLPLRYGRCHSGYGLWSHRRLRHQRHHNRLDRQRLLVEAHRWRVPALPRYQNLPRKTRRTSRASQPGRTIQHVPFHLFPDHHEPHDDPFLCRDLCGHDDRTGYRVTARHGGGSL